MQRAMHHFPSEISHIPYQLVVINDVIEDSCNSFLAMFHALINKTHPRGITINQMKHIHNRLTHV
eukprot:Gb_37446 [translate_table: standard]